MLETELRCWASFLFAILLEILKASIYLDFEIEQFYTTIIFYILCMYSWNIYGGTKKRYSVGGMSQIKKRITFLYSLILNFK